jgi:hypothetical protein
MTSAPTGMENLNAATTSIVYKMLSNWSSAGEVDIGIDQWDVGAIENFGSFLSNTTLTTACYDRVLAAWSQQTLVNTTTVDMGNSKYSDVQAHADMQAAANGYEIIDGGQA